MDWKQIDLEHLELAMNECMRLGLVGFRKLHKFRQAKNIHMYLNERGPFEARPLIAAAYELMYPERRKLIPEDFESTNAHDFLVAQFSFSKCTITESTAVECRAKDIMTAQVDLLRAEEAAGAESQDEEADSDRREVVNRQIRARRGQQQFREALLERYRHRCAVTRCEIVAILEAAHINPYRGDNDNHPTNGLLLRADIHTLFDLDLLGVEPVQLHVELHPDIVGEYGHLAGKPLICPDGIRPSRKALEARYKLFCQRREDPTQPL